MIDLKELRIGNFLHGSHIESEEVLEVTGITNIISYTRISDSAKHLNPKSFFHPIPLTEDWLFKFGFEENPSHEHPHFDKWRRPEDTDFSLDNYNDEYWVVEFLDQTYGCPEIKYVNQLQNLYFFISGQELIYNKNHK